MKLSKKSSYLLIVIILLLSSTVFTSPAAAAEVTRDIENQREKLAHYYPMRGVDIGIIFDQNDELSNNSASSIYYSLELLTPNVDFIGVSSLTELEMALDQRDFEIAIYIFPTDYNFMYMTQRWNQEGYTWTEISNLLTEFDKMHHIFAMGNTKQLLKTAHYPSNFHATGEEMVDAKHSFIYALWSLSDVLELHYQEEGAQLAEDIKGATLQFFGANFNDLVQRNLEPTDPMGVEHPDTVEARKQEFFDKHSPNFERIPREGYVIDQETGREIDPLTGEKAPDYPIDLYGEHELTPSHFILSFLPEDSGLRGPIGGVVDELLNFLISFIGDQIGLSEETLNAIFSALIAIPDLIGALSDPSSSKIKEFLDKLKPMIPIPADKLDYFDLIVDALFLLRGNFDDIQNFITSAIKMVVPDLGGSENLADVIASIFDIGSSAIASLANGDNFIDVVFSVLNERIVNDALSTFVGNLTGITINVAETVDSLKGAVNAFINLISTGDYTSFVTEYGPTLINLLPSGLSLDSLSTLQSEALMTGVSMILVATGVVKDKTLEDVFTDFLTKLFGVDADAVKDKSEKVIKSLGEFVQSPTDAATLKADISALLAEIPETSGETDKINAILDIVVLIAGIKNDGFSIEGVADLNSAVGYLLAAFGVEATEEVQLIQEILNTLVAIINFIKNPPNVSKIIGDFLSGSGLSSLTETITEFITFIINQASGYTVAVGQGISLSALSLDNTELINTISEIVSLVLSVIESAQGNSIEGLLMAILQGGAYAITQFTGIQLDSYLELAKGLFGTLIGWTEEAPTVNEVLNTIVQALNDAGVDPGIIDIGEKIISFVMGIRDIFTGGFKTIFAKMTEWLAGLVTSLVEELTGDLLNILDQEEWSFLEIEIPVAIGPFSLFNMVIEMGLKPGFAFDTEVFIQMIFDLVFKGISIFSGESSAADVLTTALKFLNIHPIFFAKLSLNDFGSGKSSFISFLLNALGLELSFSGSAWFELSLFSFKNGVFNFDDFFKVIEWGFSFTLTLSRTFTLLDFLTGGAGGSLNSIGKYIGLDAISITIGFTIGLEIVKRAATANRPESGSITVTLTIFFTVSLGIDIIIATLLLKGTLEVTLTLLQDLVEPTPMRVFISLVLIITVHIELLFVPFDFEFRWSPSGFSPEDPYELTPASQEDAGKEGALGLDQDNDGLSDKYEKETPGLNYLSPDSDGDGLDDKLETQTLESDPGNRDTDGDGLFDNIEFDIRTNLLSPDTDFDGLSDYDEAVVIGTDPLAFDTDEDGLDDFFEVNHSYNMTGITPNVENIKIGAKYYDDHTDPLNPDTDFDGIVDGEEGARGIYYGPELYNATEQPTYTPDPPLFFNGGYTHPLDNDTDDDSYEQDYSGAITPRKRFLRDMTDFTEINGIEVIFIDPETGEPETPRIVRTNPTNPDSDGDTGVTEGQREKPPFGFFLNSDGYELALSPPTDPLDGDTDDDALIDGYEGILRPDANHTDANNPDTDGDGLGDLQEFQLGSDPRSVDTDLDGVSDGDEFFKFGTSPFLEDHDGDGLLDGEELWTYHSSPFLRDTDRDGLSDYDEVWKYFSDPADEDSDNDGLDDYEEIVIHYTDPFAVDTDNDGLFDGDEVRGLNYTKYVNGTAYNFTVYTDPLKWDTDGDSLLTLDQDGEISQSMSDGDEWKLKTRPDRMDTDEDGIQDGWELWVGKGKIPDFEPLALDPLNNDTDGDSLFDGSEFVVANMSTLLYPYIGFYPLMPYNTSAVNNDTDGDTIPDNIELDIGSLPNNNDTDNDTLADNIEFYVYDTSPLQIDTDGDGLNDTQELFGYKFPEGHPLYDNTTLVLTSATNGDSDGDLLPDGAEVYYYNKDPRDPDQNGNQILDGMEPDLDSDGDGLLDGEEYFIYQTSLAGEGGGPFQPDSDRDGLFDGSEVYESFTDPSNWDTDNDTYSDGLEVICGTDPLDNSTTLDDFEACFSELSRMIILSPVHTKTYATNAVPIFVYDPDNELIDISFRYRVGNGTFSGPEMLEPDLNKGDGYWKADESFSFPLVNDTIEVEFTAERNDSEIITRTIKFTLKLEPHKLEIKSPKDGFTYQFNEFQKPKLPITVEAGFAYTNVWYRILDSNGTIFKDNTTLNYEGGLQAYHKPELEFPDEPGVVEYTIQVFANRSNGIVVQQSALFKIKTPTLEDTLIKYGAPAGGAVAVGGMAVILRRAGFKNPFKKGG